MSPEWEDLYLKESERSKEELKPQQRTGQGIKNTKTREHQPVVMMRWGHECAFVATEGGWTSILDPGSLSQ